MIKPKNVSGFFRKDYCNFASYDNQRKIASLIDGLKNSGRKVIFSTRHINIAKDMKVSVFANATSLDSKYIHGPTALEDVITNMTQQFTGSNNISWFSPQSNFGTRLLPAASSSRYIFLRETELTEMIYNRLDDMVLKPQLFEGDQVEPKFYVPIIPMLLINGSLGTTPGFKQYIFPRNPKTIISHLKSYCQDGKPVNWNIPYWNGFKGKVIKGVTDKQWIMEGVLEIKNTSTIEITELPLGYTQKKYCAILDDLEKDKIITSYQDLCDTKKDIPHFVIKMERKNLEGKTVPEMIKLLKLQTTMSETYFAYNEFGKIEEFQNIDEIMDRYIKVRLEYYGLRKIKQLQKLENELDIIKGRIKFINLIITKSIVIDKLKDSEIGDILSNNKIVTVDDSYEYLLSMAIRSLTPERQEALGKNKLSKEVEIETLRSTTEKSLWLQELKALEKKLP